jgi:16S rRNA (uracil1498-N3)-methyltransferase
MPEAPVPNCDQGLPEAAFRHAVQVLRLREGDTLTLFDGHDNEYEATLIMVARREARIRVGASRLVSRESPLHITLLQAVGKGERMDWALQKATELGATALVPVLSQRCNVHLDDTRWQKKQAHWQGVIVGACEQCGRNRLPALHAPVDLATALAAVDAEARLILDPTAEDGLARAQRPRSVALLIGPEGGLTAEEVAQARASGFHGLRLGPRILRTETAAAAALAVIQAAWGDGG